MAINFLDRVAGNKPKKTTEESVKQEAPVVAQSPSPTPKKEEVKKTAKPKATTGGISSPIQIDTKKISHSKFADRDSAWLSLEDEKLSDLVSRIEANGQKDPIRVRPTGNGKYEIIYGHRRHAACDSLGIPVLAFVEEMSDKELFLAMDEENAARQDLSPFERAMSWQRGLDEKLFVSAKQLSEQVRQSRATVIDYLALLKLPKQIVSFVNDVRAITIRPSRRFLKQLEDDTKSAELLELVDDFIKSYQPAANDSAELRFNKVIGLRVGKSKAPSLAETGVLMTKDGITYAAIRQEKGVPVIRFRKGLDQSKVKLAIKAIEEAMNKADK